MMFRLLGQQSVRDTALGLTISPLQSSEAGNVRTWSSVGQIPQLWLCNAKPGVKPCSAYHVEPRVSLKDQPNTSQGHGHTKPYILATYGNKVAMDPSKHKTNSMVILVPANKEDIHVLDSKDAWADKLHMQVAKAFDDLNAQERIMSAQLESFSFGGSTNSSLPVYHAGSYKYSLAKDVTELQRFDRREFTLSDAILKELSQHYHTNRSNSPPQCFLLMQFQALSNGEYHPLMYVYPDNSAMSTDKPNLCQVVVPARHFHPHEDSGVPGRLVDSFWGKWSPNSKSSTSPITALSSSSPDSMTNDWDHDLMFFGLRNSTSYHLVTHASSQNGGQSNSQNNTQNNTLEYRLFSSGRLIKENRDRFESNGIATGMASGSAANDPLLTVYPQANVAEKWLRIACGHLNRYIESKGITMRFHVDPQWVQAMRCEIRGRHPNDDIRLIPSSLIQDAIQQQLKQEIQTVTLQHEGIQVIHVRPYLYKACAWLASRAPTLTCAASAFRVNHND